MQATKTMGWDPRTGESQIFDSPEARDEAGWLDHHPSDEEKGGAGAVAQDDVDQDPPLSRNEVIAALNEGKVQFNARATDKQLNSALDRALRKTLSTRNIDYTNKDSTRKLLALVRGL